MASLWLDSSDFHVGGTTCEGNKKSWSHCRWWGLKKGINPRNFRNFEYWDATWHKMVPFGDNSLLYLKRRSSNYQLFFSAELLWRMGMSYGSGHYFIRKQIFTREWAASPPPTTWISGYTFEVLNLLSSTEQKGEKQFLWQSLPFELCRQFYQTKVIFHKPYLRGLEQDLSRGENT